jgi:NAD(P)-dependent dehydrogenase (short-subunit alcohol dehydrogenase family)
MKIKDKVVVVTGGASGIGRALCVRFAAEGAKGIVVSDYNGAGALEVSSEIGGLAVTTDVSDETQVKNLVAEAIRHFGPIDLFCSNAGIMGNGGIEAPNTEWQRCWEINVMAHIYAARAVLPSMLQRGKGYLLQTASAGGLLTTLGAAPYSVTKHAAVAFAEWLSITHAGDGIKVSCLCPQGVRTGMLSETTEGIGKLLMETALSPEEVAESVIQGLEKEEFLILPHPEVADYFKHKANDYERWLRQMHRVHMKYVASPE